MSRSAFLARSLLAISAALALGASVQVPPGSVILDCKIASPEHFLPSRMFLIEPPGGHQVLVWDGYVEATRSTPLPATVEADTAADLRLSWRVAGLPGHDGHGRSLAIDIDYTAVLAGGSALTMTANVRAADNPPYQSAGSCARQ